MIWIIYIVLFLSSCLFYWLGHGLGEKKGFDEGWDTCVAVMTIGDDLERSKQWQEAKLITKN